MPTTAPPARPIRNKACDSDPLDEELAERGIESIAPNRVNGRPKNAPQDRRPLRR